MKELSAKPKKIPTAPKIKKVLMKSRKYAEMLGFELLSILQISFNFPFYHILAPMRNIEAPKGLFQVPKFCNPAYLWVQAWILLQACITTSALIIAMKQFFLSLILLFTTSIAFAQTEHVSKGNTNEGIGTLIPDFKFYDMENQPVTRLSLVANAPTIFFYFDPDCDHCQLIATMITEQKELFKGITLVLVSWAEVDAIKGFPGKYLPGFPGKLIVTKDKDYLVDKWFGDSVAPSIYVYNNQYKRTASFKDEVRPEILVKFARQQ
jgi:hypothetical protein